LNRTIIPLPAGGIIVVYGAHSFTWLFLIKSFLRTYEREVNENATVHYLPPRTACVPRA
jgi:hypothetical protein